MHPARRLRATRATLAITPLIASVALFSPGVVRAQTPPPDPARGIEVQPAQLERDLGGRTFTQRLTYFNHKATPQTLRLTVREIWNRTDTPGASRFVDSAALRAAFTLDRSSVTIAAGARAAVTLRGTIASGARSAYPAVIAQLPNEAGTSVQAEYQLASMFLLRAPRPWTERIAVTDVGLIPDAGKSTYTVFATVKNIGNVHVRPRGSIEIRRAGTLLATVPLPRNANKMPFAILPTCAGGCSVRLQATWSPRAPVTSDVTLTARLVGPAASLTRTARFSSGSTGTLSATIAFGAVSPSEIAATITNDGGVTLSQASVRFVARAGPFERGRAEFPQESLDPGASRAVTWRPDQALPNGTYTITAELLSGTRSLSVATTTLQVGPLPSGGRSLLLLVVAGLLLLAAAILLFLFWKRRRRSSAGGEGQVVRGAA